VGNAKGVANGRSAETSNKWARHLLALWRFAAKKRYVDEFPTVELFQTPKRIPRAWLREEIERLFKAASETSGMMNGVPAGKWWTALLATMWWTGERITAVLSLQWSDFDTGTGWIVAPAEVRKGKYCDKAFWLPPDACNVLEQIRVPGNLKIFNWPLKQTSIFYRYKRLLKRAGLPNDRMSMFHRIRRSMASHLKFAGGDPQQALGHTNGAVTARYLDPRVTASGAPKDLLFNPLPKLAGEGGVT
jgi:integrase